MDEVKIPVLDAILSEINNARGVKSMLPAYREAYAETSDSNAELREKNIYLTKRLSDAVDDCSVLGAQNESLDAQAFEDRKRAVELEGELWATKETLRLAQEDRMRLQQSNTNLHRVILNHESTIRVLKRELGQ